MPKFERVAENKFYMRNDQLPGSEFGHFVELGSKATGEDIAKAKQEVVERICATIRDIANKREDFFIIKKSPFGPGMTVAAKFVLPTVDRYS